MIGIDTQTIKDHITQINLTNNYYSNLKSPKLSIITPSYNQEQYLEKTILSIINQGYPNLELIIIDGGSQDDSIDILKKYDQFITYWVSEKDKGQSNALNKGLAQASGEWIGWQNSDDIYLPGAFIRFAEVIGFAPHAEVVYGNKICIDESDVFLYRSFYTKPNMLIYKNISMTMCNQSAFIKRSLIDRIGWVNEELDFAMDHELFLRFIENNVNMVHDDKIWGASRYHSQSKGCSDNDENWAYEHSIIYNGNRFSAFYIRLLAKYYRYLLIFLDNNLRILFDELIHRAKRIFKH